MGKITDEMLKKRKFDRDMFVFGEILSNMRFAKHFENDDKMLNELSDTYNKCYNEIIDEYGNLSDDIKEFIGYNKIIKKNKE